MQRWSALTRRNREFQRKSRHLMHAFTNSKTFFSFAYWKAKIQEATRERAKLKKVLARMLQRSVAMMFDGWLQVRIKSRAMHGKKHKVLRYLTNMQLVMAFGKWRHNCEETKRIQFVGRKIMSRVLNAALAVAFDSWAQTTKEQMLMRGKTRKIIYRLTRNCVVQSIHVWSQVALTTRNSRATMAKILARMQNACTANAFVTWFEVIKELKRQRRDMQRVVLRIKLMPVVMCWDKWCDAVLHRREVLSRARKVFVVWTGMQGDICRLHFDAWADLIFSLGKEEEEAKPLPQVFSLGEEEEEAKPLPQGGENQAQICVETITNRPTASVNTVRIAKGFFQWANNLWWSRELTMQHERFVLLLQVLSFCCVTCRERERRRERESLLGTIRQFPVEMPHPPKNRKNHVARHRVKNAISPESKNVSRCFRILYRKKLKHLEVCLRYQQNRIFNFFPMALRSPHVVLLMNMRDSCWTLPQQRQANQLLQQWEPFMVSPHPVRGSSPSKQLSKMILNAGGSRSGEQGRADASMWEHVYQSRTPTKEAHHVPTATPSMYKSPNSKQHTPIRSPGSREKLKEREKVRELRNSPTRIFHHTHSQEY